jgi:hypothetical protein
MIDFERPIRQAWERTRARLFAPFELKKWLWLGFGAWLASFLTGGGPSFNFSFPGKARGNAQEWLGALDPLTTVAIACGVVLAVGLLLIALMWVGSRAQFLFLDNILRDHAEIRRPWREFRARGNRFFVFYTWVVSIPAVLALLLVFAALLVFWPELTTLTWPAWGRLIPWIAALGALGGLTLVWSIAMLFYRDFGVPILYASDCAAGEAFRRVWEIARARPGDCALYLLVRIGLGMAFLFLSMAVTLITCCVGGLPYVNSVLTLPLWVFRQSFVLDCLAQLAPEYTLWREEPPPLA